MVTADWESWLTQDDVDGMVAAGLNSVRIPLGFWIVEDIVDTSHEHYPRLSLSIIKILAGNWPYAEGGLDELVRDISVYFLSQSWTLW